MATVFKRAGRRNYYYAYFDARGRRVVKSSGTAEHAAAQRIANHWESNVALRREGVIDTRLEAITQEAAKPLADTLKAFEAALSSAGKSDKHTQATLRYIQAIAEDRKFSRLNDIDPDSVNVFANRLQSENKSARTIAAYLQAIKHFTRWAVKTGKLSSDPLASVSKPSPERDRRRIRRYLSHEEWDWLDSETRRSNPLEGMTGQERALLYALAIQSGLRAGELRALTRGKLHLAEQPPFVLAHAADTKNKKPARQYIQPELARELQNLTRVKVAGATVFNAPERLAEMLRADLAAARNAWLETFKDPQKRMEADASDFLKDLDSEGHRIDFHALRHTCATWLIQSGADVQTVQRIMRHSDIKLTLERYGHLFPGAEADAVSRLRNAFSNSSPIAATGTETSKPEKPMDSAARSAQGAFGVLSGATTCNMGEAAGAGPKKRISLKFVGKANENIGKKLNAPARTRTLDPLIKSQQEDQENAGNSSSAQRGAQHSLSAELAEVVESWATLGPEFRSAILGLIRAKAHQNAKTTPQTSEPEEFDQ